MRGFSRWRRGPAGTGAGYGLLLAVVGLAAVDFGNGLYTPVAVFSAPAFVLDMVVTVAAIPPLWALLFAAAVRTDTTVRRLAFAGMMLLHYASGVLYTLSAMPAMAEMPISVTAGLFTVIGGAVYLRVQVMVWTHFARAGSAVMAGVAR